MILTTHAHIARNIRFKCLRRILFALLALCLLAGASVRADAAPTPEKKTESKTDAKAKSKSKAKKKAIQITNMPSGDVFTASTFRLGTKLSSSKYEDRDIIWTSSKKSVATVSKKGKVKTKKKGTTTITATIEDTSKKASFRLRVKARVKLKKILGTENAKVYVGDTLQLDAVPVPENTTQRNFTWSSSDKNVATVDEKGQVSGKKAGAATITVKEKASGKKMTSRISVVDVPVTGISFPATNAASIECGDKQQLLAQVAPPNATNKNLKWSSSNKSAATVDENGIVTALRPIETVTITASSEDNAAISATWEIKITRTHGYLTKASLDALDLTVINKVMIVAHPDDETLWGGAHLLKDEYLVVCLTHNWNERRRAAFTDTMRLTNDKYLILDYPDTRKTFANGSYETDTLSTCRSAMSSDIWQILTYKKWKEVATHNPFGEYGKFLHQQISSMVTESFNKYFGGKSSTSLYYFGHYYPADKIPGEPLASDVLATKQRMVDRYYSTGRGAIVAFGHMIPYENWLLPSEWK